MRFETVLNAYRKASIELSQMIYVDDSFYRRRRQAAKFRAWLIAYAAKSCRPKRLEWKKYENRSCYEAYSPVGRYEIWRGMNGYSCYFLPIPGESKMFAESIDSLDAAQAMAQAHFDRIWHEMTEFHPIRLDREH